LVVAVASSFAALQLDNKHNFVIEAVVEIEIVGAVVKIEIVEL
jgi:hypothetical protein